MYSDLPVYANAAVGPYLAMMIMQLWFRFIVVLGRLIEPYRFFIYVFISIYILMNTGSLTRTDWYQSTIEDAFLISQRSGFDELALCSVELRHFTRCRPRRKNIRKPTRVSYLRLRRRRLHHGSIRLNPVSIRLPAYKNKVDDCN